MSEHKYYDDDIEKVVNMASIGRDDLVEVLIKDQPVSVHLHKDDIVHLARCFGFTVFNKEDELL